ncbi:hypothetical protein ACH4UM_20440 [Streptomyces sp. NPDC020801]|uniref:hypothetical protein n=1 Tax=unclassified Streptomyces TaxID=2593676 RepID=UPI003797E443
MSEAREDEPFLVRSRSSPSGYVYNPRSRAGLAAIFFSLAVTGAVLLWQYDDSHWSESELRSATHQAATALEQEPQPRDDWDGYNQYGLLMEEAIDKTGAGPSFGAMVREEGDSPDFTVTGGGTDAAFCMHLTESFGARRDQVHLGITVADGRCTLAP